MVISLSRAQKSTEVHVERGTDRLRPVGRAIQKTSTGRHASIIAEPAEEGARSSPIKNAIKAIGRAAATVFLACAVGALVTACYKGQGQNEDYAAPNEVDDKINPSLVVSSENLCGEYSGADYEAALPLEGRALLAPIGHWMRVAELNSEGTSAKLILETDLYVPVDSEGNPAEEPVSQPVDADSHTFAVSFGGETQHITLCDVIEGEDGEELAYFVTDHPDGFMHCDYVHSGSLGVAEEYEFNSTITQSVVASKLYHGFIPNIETGEDPECPGTEALLKWEESSFESLFPLGLISLPGMGFSNTLVINGVEYVFSKTGGTTGSAYLEIAHEAESAVLGEVFESIELNGLVVTWTGVSGSGVPTFSYSYPDSDFISEEALTENDKTILVWSGSEVLSFSVRFSTPGGIMGNTLSITLLQGVERIEEGGTVELSGVLYDTSLVLEATSETLSGYGISRFRVTPVTD